MAGSLFPSSGSKGASGAENQIAGSQYDFMQTLQRDFGTTFAGQQNIINGLTKAAQNILAAGPSQFGFSAPELTARNTLATTANAVATRNAMTAAAQAGAATGAGGAALPTGAEGARQAQIAQLGQEDLSNKLLGIQEAGYNTGRQNYYDSEKTMAEAANLENPTAYGNLANSAGRDAFDSANTINKENQAANPWTQVGGLVGSLAGTALSMIPGGQVPGAILSKIGGMASKSNQNFQNTYQPQSLPTGFDPTVSEQPMPLQSLDMGLYGQPFSG